MSSQQFFVTPSRDALKKAFVGRSLHDMPVPSAILDVAKVRQNCKLMLDAVEELKVSFRAHVKTHKTAELTRLQVGEDCKDVRLIVSTVIEAESLLDLLKHYQARGSKVNVLYGVPLGASHVSRLAALAKELGPGTITVMIDDPHQLDSVKKITTEAGYPIAIFIKTDSGYHRAGLAPSSTKMQQLVEQVSLAESQGDLTLLGFYSHNSLSYGGNSPDDAMSMLKVEIEVCHEASKHFQPNTNNTTRSPLVISVGASPTALAIQNLQSSTSTSTSSSSPPPSTTTNPEISSSLHTLLKTTIQTFDLEIHAGVYPILDLQQIAASSRPYSTPLASHIPLALTILTETVSTYPDRTSSPEALITAGCLALAREPCKSYPGWGVLTAWNLPPSLYTKEDAVRAESRVIVGRVSQEHGILCWEDSGRKEELPVKCGGKVRVWPNHACITGAGFEWYLIVDSERGSGDEVVDVWVRWRGW